MEIVNMTPHVVNVMENEGTVEEPEWKQVLAIEPSGDLIRLGEKRESVTSLNGATVWHHSYADVDGTLPHLTTGTIFLVSMKIATKVPERTDFVCPGQIVLDDEGNRLGCDGLSSVSGMLILSDGEEE